MNNGDIGYCACKQSCTENEGDCDLNYQCKDGYRCGSNNCPNSYGFDSNTDFCYVAIIGDENFCTVDNPCAADEGDCDYNDECQTKLFCGSNNCPHYLGVSSSVDCCEPQGKLLLKLQLHIWMIFTYSDHQSLGWQKLSKNLSINEFHWLIVIHSKQIGVF